MMSDVGKEAGMSEEEMASLLNSDAGGADDGSAQIIDTEGNTVTVSAAQMAAVGIDTNSLNEITEDQIASLMALANGPAQPQADPDPAAAAPSGDLTMLIGEDGSLKLLDPSGSEFALSPADLAAAGIDIANLDEDAVQTIVQLAMGAPKPPVDKDSPPPKRARQDYAAAPEENGAARAFPPQNRAQATSSSFTMIGKEVEIRKGGRAQNATIRYCRQGAGLKVQFDDGHFEWVQEDQVTMKGAKPSGKDGVTNRSPAKALPSVPHNGSVNSNLGRRVPPAVPGIRVTPQAESSSLSGGGSSGRCGDPNFVCPICESAVYQKEPAYIVIRLPACESCADSKILVLDQNDDAAQSPAPPAAQLPPPQSVESLPS